MTYAYVQSKGSVNGAAQTTVPSGAFSSSVGAGSVIAVFVHYFSFTQPVDIAVARNSVALTQLYNSFNGFDGFWMGYLENAAAGTNEVVATATVSGSPQTLDGGAIICAEYSGLATASSLVGSAATFLGSPTNATDGWSTGNITPTGQPAAVVCGAIDINGNNLVTGTGFTARVSWADINYGKLEDKRITALTAVPGTYTGGTGDYGFIGAMIFAEPSTAVSHAMLIGVG